MFRDVLRLRRLIVKMSAGEKIELLQEIYLLHLPAKQTLAASAMILFVKKR